MPTVKIAIGSKFGLVSIHGQGTGVETLLAEYKKQGGNDGDGWVKAFPFHKGLESDGFSEWCLGRGITLAKSKDGKWAVAVKTESVVKLDRSGYPLAVRAEKVMWRADK